MNELFGSTRDVVKNRYALRTPSGFVPSVLPGWSNCVCVIQISPAMGANFAQFLITLEANGVGRGNSGATEFFIFVVSGNVAAKIGRDAHALKEGSYLFLPSNSEFELSSAAKGTQLLLFQKRYEPLAGKSAPAAIVGHEQNIPGNPFLGNDDARLQVLLPDELAFDMAVNIFTYQPGTTLPFVETHIMEHGLMMLRGHGVYRLDADYHPVTAGDVIWMAPYCPQWFVAMGKSPASYIYYKDVNRAPLV